MSAVSAGGIGEHGGEILLAVIGKDGSHLPARFQILDHRAKEVGAGGDTHAQAQHTAEFCRHSNGIQIVDIRHKPTRDDMTMAEWFRASGKPWVIIANKLDKIKKSQLEGNIAEIRQTLLLPEEVPVIPFSAEKGMGREEVLSIIFDHAARKEE